MGNLDGKHVIITGAAQGMGAVHARRCVEEGARVLLTDLQAEAGEKLAASLGEAAGFEAHGRDPKAEPTGSASSRPPSSDSDRASTAS